MERFNVTGMSCAACSARVEKVVSALPGVEAVSVNLLTNSMGVEFTAPATEETICQAVAKAGYGASPVIEEAKTSAPGRLAVRGEGRSSRYHPDLSAGSRTDISDTR